MTRALKGEGIYEKGTYESGVCQESKAVNTKVQLLFKLLACICIRRCYLCSGEIIRQIAYNKVGVNEENSYIVVSICLVFLSVILTGFQVYEPLAKWCGAGTLVPITGFANSVASPAIEYQKEGQVFGIGVKIFTIAGPVILYGVFSSWVVGVIYWLFSR